jgi:1-acyl-sn-glycerol-3-phosphate acyltransferase
VQGKNRHVLLFPEGGRYTDNTIHHFFAGFAMLAAETGRPVVPVLLYNVNKVFPPKSFLIHPNPITIIIGKPFIFTENETEEQFITRVRDWFVEQLAQQQHT